MAAGAAKPQIKRRREDTFNLISTSAERDRAERLQRAQKRCCRGRNSLIAWTNATLTDSCGCHALKRGYSIDFRGEYVSVSIPADDRDHGKHDTCNTVLQIGCSHGYSAMIWACCSHRLRALRRALRTHVCLTVFTVYTCENCRTIGNRLQACTCGVRYCSPACQRADWPDHKGKHVPQPYWEQRLSHQQAHSVD